MNETAPTSESLFSSVLAKLALAIAFCLAVAAILNSMPSVWIIPKIGPFKAEYLRSIVLVAAVVIVLIGDGFARKAQQHSPRLVYVGLLADVAILVCAVVVGYYYTIINLEIEESLFFFEAW